MFLFIKQILISTMILFSSLPNVNSLECVSIKYQECEVRPKIVDINCNSPIFYPVIIKINKCSGSCNNINNPYAKACVPDVIKDFNVRVFNLMSKTNETRFIKWHQTCKCICRLDGITCNTKQRWSEDICRCECNVSLDKFVCDKGFIWNPSNCESECDKSCNIDKYLDYSDCKCKTKSIDPLVEECEENINETSLVPKTLDKSEDRCNSYVVYRAFFWTFCILFLISIEISIYFVYCNYVIRNKYDLPY